MKHRLFFLRHSFSSGKSFPSGPKNFAMSGPNGFDDDEDAGVEDLEGFFEAEAVFEESEDVAEDVPKDRELEEPDTFASLAWGLSSELCSQ